MSPKGRLQTSQLGRDRSRLSSSRRGLEFLGYASTWSAVRSVRDAGRDEILEGFAQAFANPWDDPSRCREVRWPVNMRTGKT